MGHNRRKKCHRRPVFDPAEVYVDGINVLEDDFNYVISQTEAFVIGQNAVIFDVDKMHMGF